MPLLLALIAVAVVSRGLGGQHLLIGATEPVPLPWAAVLPALTAYLTTAVAWSALPLEEHLAVHRVDLHDLLYLTVAVLVGAGLVAWAAQPLIGTITEPGAIRNYLGLLGYSLLGAAAFRLSMGWTIPTTLFTTGLVVAGTGADLPPLDWPARHDNEPTSWAVSITILIAGIAAFASPTRRRAHALRAARTEAD
ncbi:MULTISPECIES: hypothetical protein [unclassified Micromonospora]|uniref:hypothetical protein n=1 Tax=unclassified Micromonospora TaxID=2617518 RepID=UPI0022B63AB7|nr:MULTISPECIES: hypothetical protein [unclassified Micromonospora]MCZ7421655.1 hypothetical protein [Verrucosispora sp. WMMA2121]WBB93666.1 hypothetical protein O7597_12175 [Verrucosispora sp. WMMC514]